MDGGIVEDKSVVVIRIVFSKDVDSVINLPQNILVGEVPFSVRPRPKEYSSRVCSIRGTQPAVVGGDEVRDHQRDTFTLWQGEGFLADMDPTALSPIILVEYALIVKPEDIGTGR